MKEHRETEIKGAQKKRQTKEQYYRGTQEHRKRRTEEQRKIGTLQQRNKRTEEKGKRKRK